MAARAAPRTILVRGARAFSCDGSVVGDLRRIHAVGDGVERLPISARTVATVLVLDSRPDRQLV